MMNLFVQDYFFTFPLYKNPKTMISISWAALLTAAIILLITGFIWYHPKMFGTGWRKPAGLNAEQNNRPKMGRVFGVTIFFGFLMAFIFQFMVIHQFSVFALLSNDPALKDLNSELSIWFKDFMCMHGSNFRTFKNGCLHGFMGGLTLALPIVGINLYLKKIV